jgi:hypothetical protein
VSLSKTEVVRNHQICYDDQGRQPKLVRNMLFALNSVLESFGLDLTKTRLVRHESGYIGHWNRGENIFNHEASLQNIKPDPYAGASNIIQFVPGPRLKDGDQTALLLTAHRILGSHDFDGAPRPFRLFSPDAEGKNFNGGRAFDLETIPEFLELSKRILIRWGTASSTRSWSQWAYKQPKEILEFRRSADEVAFPGFARLTLSIDELFVLPQSWQGALSSVQGVYLLVCSETGEQYVGSAYGQGGFMARWLAYADNGHGGNLLLRRRNKTNYSVTILEVASPDMSPTEIISREGAWKRKLGSRAHGLNAN